MNDSPAYKHDCSRCQFLGQTIGGGKIHDLYLHPGPNETVIARFSDNGPDYYSTPIEYARPDGHSELWAAATLAKRKV